MIRVAERQDGLVSRVDLEVIGVSAQARRTRVAEGRLVPIPGGVFLLGGIALTWERRVRAAQLATGGVVSHFSAAAWHGFHRIGRGAVEVTVPYGSSARLRGAKVHRSKLLDDADVDRRTPMPITSPERTLIDVARRLGPTLLRACLDDAARSGTIDLALLRQRLDDLRSQGLRGASRLARLMAERGTEPLLDSWLERRAAEVIRASDLPAGRWQAPMVLDGVTLRVDLLYDLAALVVEFDGHGSHATRAERMADAERMARLTAHGYCVLRFTYEDVTDRPEYVVATIARHLAVRTPC